MVDLNRFCTHEKENVMRLSIFIGIIVSILALTPCQASISLSIQQGISGYSGTLDTHLDGAAPDSSFGTDSTVTVDGPGGGSFANHAVLRFGNIFEDEGGQIPLGSQIVSATLTIDLLQSGDVGAGVHRMLQPWAESDTWNNHVNGIDIPGVEYSVPADASIGVVNAGLLSMDVTASLQAWSDGDANYGWVFQPGLVSPDGWTFSSSETPVTSDRPMLEVAFVPLPPTISQQPECVLIPEGGGIAVFTIAASGAGILSYQWFHDGMPLSDGALILGSNSPQLTVSAQGSEAIGEYHCEASNPGGTAGSNAGILGLRMCPGDANTDGIVDVNDISYVLFRLGNLCP